jgi:hypothetical protein
LKLAKYLKIKKLRTRLKNVEKLRNYCNIIWDEIERNKEIKD